MFYQILLKHLSRWWPTDRLSAEIRALDLKALGRRALGLQPGWSELPQSVRLFLLLVWLIGAGCVAWSIHQAHGVEYSLLTILLFILLAVISEWVEIEMRSGEAVVNLRAAASIAIVLLLPAIFVPLVAAASTTLTEMHAQRAWFKKSFNIAQMIIADTVAALIFHHFGSPDLLVLITPRNVAILATIWGIHYMMNTGLVVMVIALAVRESPLAIWRSDFGDAFIDQILLTSLGTLIALILYVQPWFLILAIVPIYLMRRSLDMIAELRRQTTRALSAFADSVDQRDPTTFNHSCRVAELSRAIAEEMGLARDEVEMIYLSGRVHDIGKVGIPDAVLLKPGRLTDEEYEMIKSHPVIGVEIIEHFPNFGIGYEIIRHHHERFDGKGYPDGLAGEEIPLGARIMAVADTYDAMTSDRPYRAGLSPEVAIAEIAEQSGTQFDPAVVAAFLRVIRRMVSPAPEAKLRTNGACLCVIDAQEPARVA